MRSILRIRLCIRSRKVFFSRRGLDGLFVVCAGIQRYAFVARPVWFFWGFRWHPRYAFVLHASPLCGAAPTFLCRRKEK